MKRLALILLLLTAPAAAADTPYALFVAGRYDEAARAGEASRTADGLALAARATLTDDMLRETPCLECLQQAERLARAALAADPHNAEAHVWLAAALGYQVRVNGILWARLHDVPTQAKAALQAALTQAPGDALAQSAMGGWNIEVVKGAGGFLAGMLYGAAESDALAHFDTAVKLAPGNVSVRYQIALALAGYNPDHYRDRILAELDAVIRAKPQNAYEQAVQERAGDLAGLLRQGNRLAFDAHVRILQGYR